jgi:hypothetical protein
MTPRLEQALATRLELLAFPGRLETFFARRGLVTVGDFVAFAPSALLLEPNLGRKSIADAHTILESKLGSTWEELQRALTGPSSANDLAAVDEDTVPVSVVPEGVSWKDLLREAFRQLDSTARLIVTQRSGLVAPPVSLAEIGECLGVSRERVRQIEGAEADRRSRVA